MGRARQHYERGPLSGRSKEQHTVVSVGLAGNQHGGMVPSLHTHEVQRLCSAILQHLGRSGPDMPPPVCNLKQLKDHLAACWMGAEMKAGAVHVALMALESVGAVTRAGHGPNALYAFNSQRSNPQGAPCPEGTSAGGLPTTEGPAGEELKEAHTSEHVQPQPVAWHVMQGMVAVKIPLFEQKVPELLQRETRCRKGAAGKSKS